MSVLIKGMEMPKNCTYCDSIGLNVAIGCPVMTGINGRATDCPLVEIPAHGRLVDADALMQTYCRHEFSSDMGDAMEILDNYPTVIEAEEDQEE